MFSDAHVYCTDCKNFKLEPDFPEYPDVPLFSPACEFADKCCLLNPEDSMPFSDRPYYESV